uniref:Uncharacterized protein n=1 Tax=Aceria tosichella TaxID=561515 RepID=A0A6G1S9T3_9ACAR
MFKLSSRKSPSSRTSSSSSSLPMNHPKLTSGRPITVSVISKTLCVTLMLSIADWLTFESLFNASGSLNRVEAALWPKARICFNSMTNSFQSGCVYCDSRLYASTITACTGQPVLANNITQAQAFCIATACLQQTGKQPTVLGRRRRRKKRSLLNRPITLGLNSNRSRPVYLGPNGNVTAQFANSLNGTTSGNLAFVLNRPAQALWLNPLSRVLTRNTNTNKNLQWQFGKTKTPMANEGVRGTAAGAGAGGSIMTGAGRPAGGGQTAASPPPPRAPATPAPAPRPAAGAGPATSRPASATTPSTTRPPAAGG